MTLRSLQDRWGMVSTWRRLPIFMAEEMESARIFPMGESEKVIM